MTTTIFGDAGTFTLDDATAPEVVFPANGEPVDAAAVATGAVQTVADYIARVATEAKLEKLYGVSRITTVASIAAIRATTGQTDRDLILFFNPAYNVGNGILSGFGLYIFSSSSTAPETAIPGVPNAYLTIEPTAGGGRWINAAASLGYSLIGIPSFVPRPVNRISLFHAEDYVVGDTTTSTITGDTVAPAAPFAPEMGPVTLLTNDQLSVDVSLTSSSSTSGASAHSVVLEYKEGVGGTWTPITGAIQTVIGANDTVFTHTLTGVLTAPADNFYYFRVGLLGPTGKSVKTSKTWSFRGLFLSSH